MCFFFTWAPNDTSGRYLGLRKGFAVEGLVSNPSYVDCLRRGYMSTIAGIM